MDMTKEWWYAKLNTTCVKVQGQSETAIISINLTKGLIFESAILNNIQTVLLPTDILYSQNILIVHAANVQKRYHHP